MKKFRFVLLLLTLTSCSSFDRMKYRHLHKVPATPQQFGSSDKTTEPLPANQFSELKNSDSSAGEIRMQRDSATNVTQQEVNIVFGLSESEDSVVVSVSPAERHELNLKTPIRRDWSLVIGLLFLAGGLVALLLCIFYYPFAGLNFLWTVIFELFTLYAAWRLLGSGIVYFVTRFRSKRNFSER